MLDTPSERKSHGPWVRPRERTECPHCGQNVSLWFGIPTQLLSYLDLTVAPEVYRVFVGEREIAVTPRLGAILSILVKLAGGTLTRTQLLNRLGLWDIQPDTMNVHVWNLKRRLEAAGAQTTIRTGRGEYGSGDGPLWSLGARQ